ncbi:UDP-N-acetylmuramoyl-tripeptide--D-alanyl-D-alanine ligase [Nonlabens sp.]|uniref:UDP-N-acetylmuramoyl-tripeptide--D-alanyl-D- alanine ligase n=1 Tax=Nonlabens sp. TaxID=1888209 RepID=UPI003F69CB66
MEKLYSLFLSSKGVQTDTRKLVAGELFFALSGDQFDGNNYVEQALEKGATHTVSSDLKFINNPDITVVEDVLKTLQDLATHHRKQLNLSIVALTGSNGKTTTKELILSVLSQKYRVKGTAGNFNNHIGVPLTLLSFNSTTEIGIVEMGANHMKEIETLASIALPDYGLITNYGKAHLEGFGSAENIKIGKSELYENLKKHHKTAIVAHWDPEQLKRSQGINQLITNDDYLLEKAEPFIHLKHHDKIIPTRLTGAYNYHNMLLAATVGRIFKLSDTEILKGLSSYEPTNNRSQIIKIDQLKIILDAYNANPSSMAVALENLNKQTENKKIAILGDMFELGTYAAYEHQHIADLTEQLALDTTYLIGDNFTKVNSKNAIKFDSFKSFKDTFSIDTQQEAVLLIKGSRGMELERIIELLK